MDKSTYITDQSPKSVCDYTTVIYIGGGTPYTGSFLANDLGTLKVDTDQGATENVYMRIIYSGWTSGGSSYKNTNTFTVKVSCPVPTILTFGATYTKTVPLAAAASPTQLI